LGWSETTLIGEIAIAGFGKPGRHIAAGGGGGDLARVGQDVGIVEHGEGSGATGAMA
jgi:hypothetical protein